MIKDLTPFQHRVLRVLTAWELTLTVKRAAFRNRHPHLGAQLDDVLVLAKENVITELTYGRVAALMAAWNRLPYSEVRTDYPDLAHALDELAAST